MGLDMYLYSAKKPNLNSETIYDRDCLNSHVILDKQDLKKPAYEALEYVARPFQVKSTYIDLIKLSADYGLQGGDICMESFESIGFRLYGIETVSLLNKDLLSINKDDPGAIKELVKDKLTNQSEIIGVYKNDGDIVVEIAHSSKQITLLRKEVHEKYSTELVEEKYLVELDELQYLGNDHTVQEFFLNERENIENLGYYEFDVNYINENIEKLNMHYPITVGEEDVLVYHEWY